MEHPKGNAPGAETRGASVTNKSGRIDGPKFNTNPGYHQPEDRFGHAVTLRTAAAWAIVRLARQRAISIEHAATVADLSGIGGRAN